jgi:hypothetical protein
MHGWTWRHFVLARVAFRFTAKDSSGETVVEFGETMTLSKVNGPLELPGPLPSPG